MGWAKALYIDSLYAQEEQERRKTGMAVNSGSLMLKRCREAQKMYGNDHAPYAPTHAVRMDKKVRATLQNRFDSRARSSGLGSSNDGNDTPTRERQSENAGADGLREKCCSVHAQNTQRLADFWIRRLLVGGA